MKITKIEAQVKTRGRYSIFVDDKFAFGLSESALINSGIKVGTEITAKDLTDFKQDSELDKIYGRLLDLLARRPRSEWELHDYLKRKKVDNEDADKLLNKLSNDTQVHGIIVQLPLINESETDRIVNMVVPDKDVDALARVTNFEPATPMAIILANFRKNTPAAASRPSFLAAAPAISAASPYSAILSVDGLKSS